MRERSHHGRWREQERQWVRGGGGAAHLLSGAHLLNHLSHLRCVRRAARDVEPGAAVPGEDAKLGGEHRADLVTGGAADSEGIDRSREASSPERCRTATRHTRPVQLACVAWGTAMRGRRETLRQGQRSRASPCNAVPRPAEPSTAQPDTVPAANLCHSYPQQPHQNWRCERRGFAAPASGQARHTTESHAGGSQRSLQRHREALQRRADRREDRRAWKCGLTQAQHSWSQISSITAAAGRSPHESQDSRGQMHRRSPR